MEAMETKDEIILALRSIETCAIADALQQMDIHCYMPNLKLMPMKDTLGSTVCGRAQTVLMMPSKGGQVLPTKDIPVDIANPDSVIVISSPSDCTSAVWGGLMSRRARYRGCLGAVISGRCRDLQENYQLNFPIFAKGSSVHGNKSINTVVEIDSTILVDGCVVRPGDVIHGDINGVVVIPKEVACATAELAQRLIQEDLKVAQQLNKGMTLSEACLAHRWKSK